MQNNSSLLNGTLKPEYGKGTQYCMVNLFQCWQLQAPQNWPIDHSPLQWMWPEAQRGIGAPTWGGCAVGNTSPLSVMLKTSLLGDPVLGHRTGFTAETLLWWGWGPSAGHSWTISLICPYHLARKTSCFCLTCFSFSNSKPGCSGWVMLICSLIRELQTGAPWLGKDIGWEGLLRKELYLSCLSSG